MVRPDPSTSLKMHSCFSTIRRVTMASIMLPSDCILLNRYDAGFVLPPVHLTGSGFQVSQLEVSFQRLTERKYIGSNFRLLYE